MTFRKLLLPAAALSLSAAPFLIPGQPPAAGAAGPRTYATPESLAVISRVRNYGDLTQPFRLDTATTLRIVAVGEGKPDEREYPWHCDNVDLFFDMHNDKKVGFDSRADDRNLRLFTNAAGREEVGTNTPMPDLVFRRTDPSPGAYLYELSIPWPALSFRPAAGRTFGFDCSVNDNDGLGTEGKIAWHATDGDIWLNTRLYGNLVLGPPSGPAPGSDSVMYARYLPGRITIDGTADPAWRDVPVYPAGNVIVGSVAGPADLSVTLQAAWNRQYLYFLIRVRDDHKRPVALKNIIWDYGWVEDAAGNRVWQMMAADTRHAGGAFKNRLADTLVHLPAGAYKLRYTSDENHAHDHWDDDPPAVPFYGIAVLKNR
jgi:hypothetical protein